MERVEFQHFPLDNHSRQTTLVLSILETGACPEKQVARPTANGLNVHRPRRTFMDLEDFGFEPRRSTGLAAQYFGCSPQHLRNLRVLRTGPPFEKVNQTRVVYRKVTSMLGRING